MRIRSALGMAPINGPTKGMMFVTPTITPISAGEEKPISRHPRKQRTPTIAESSSFPSRKPWKIWSIK